MNELILNATSKINDTLQVEREQLRQQIGTLVTTRAAKGNLQSGGTAIEASKLCETLYEKAAAIISQELLWAVEKSIYPTYRFVIELETIASRYIENLGITVDEQMQKATKLAHAPPLQLDLHLQTVKERALSQITTTIRRCRIERARKLLLTTLGILLSASVAGAFIKFLIAHFF